MFETHCLGGEGRRRGRVPVPAMLLILLAATSTEGAAGGSVPEEIPEEVSYCLMCHEDGGETLELDDGTEMSLDVDVTGFFASAHGSELVCTDCHQGYDDMDEHPVGRTFPDRRSYVLASYDVCRECHFDTYTRTLESIHFTLLEEGLEEAPVCTDCHGAHAIADPRQKEAMLSRSCANCHEEVVELYSASVHGQSLHEGHQSDVPACVDCHTAHSIADPGTPGFHLGSPEICIGCHGDAERMAPYDVPVDVATTYLADFHGVTATLADPETVEERQLVVTCIDCHGVHDIASPALLPAGEMKSRVQNACASCHEGAAEDFPDAWLSHYRPSLENAPLVYLVQIFYRIFIPFVVLGLALQVGLHLTRHAVRR